MTNYLPRVVDLAILGSSVMILEYGAKVHLVLNIISSTPNKINFVCRFRSFFLQEHKEISFKTKELSNTYQVQLSVDPLQEYCS